MGSAGKIRLTGFSDLFQVPELSSGEPVQELPLAELHPFEGHPFQIRDDENMREMAESIAQHGVLVPGIVRPRREGGYEIVAGHRRKRGSELAGKDTMPAIVRELDDDTATLFMVDSNLQREQILPSEKAWAYRMKLEALKHQGERTDLSSARGVLRLNARDQVAREAGERSGMAVTRYIALTNLIPGLLELVDQGKLSVSAAADYLSGLPEESQRILLEVMNETKTTLVPRMLSRLREQSRQEALTRECVYAILSESRSPPDRITFKGEIRRFFPPSYTSRQMEEVILSLLEDWSNRQS